MSTIAALVIVEVVVFAAFGLLTSIVIMLHTSRDRPAAAWPPGRHRLDLPSTHPYWRYRA